jgi:ABC-type transport system substrate-binding protein
MKVRRTSTRSLVLVWLVVLGLILSACSSPATPTPQRPAATAVPPAATATPVPPAPTATTGPTQGGTLIVATQADVATFDPHHTGDVPSAMVQQHIFETLVQWTDEGLVGPGLATSWEWSPDGLTLTMQLKKGVKFHDGTDFNSQAVKYNFDRMLNPDNALRARPQVVAISEVQTPDDYTVVFKLSETSGPLMSNLAATQISIVSPAAFEKYGADISLHPVGTGPFEFVQWDTKDKVVVKAFAGYHGKKPYLDEIIFRPVPDQQARVAMLEAGDAQVAAPIPLQDIERIKADNRFVVEGIAGMDNLHMPLNNLLKPLDDVRVRQALNYAVDKDALVNSVYMGYATPLTDSPLAPAMFGYVPVGDFYKYDVAKAKQLLADAGYPDGFKMTIWIPDGRYVQDRRVSEATAGYLKDIGVDVELQTYEWATYVSKLLGSEPYKAEYSAVLISFAVGTRDADRGMASIYESTQWVPKSFNLSFYANENVDKAIQTARRSTDPQERLSLYAEAGKQIMEDAPALFLVAYQFVGAYSAKVHGAKLDPNGGVVVKDAWVEK